MLLEVTSKLQRLWYDLRTWRNVRKSIRVSNMLVDEILKRREIKEEEVDAKRSNR